jgi:hypothetical protein
MAVGRFGVGPRVAVTLAATVVLTAVVTTAGGAFSPAPVPTTTTTTSTSTTDAPRPEIVVRDIRTFDELTDCLPGGAKGLSFSVVRTAGADVTDVTLAAKADGAVPIDCGSALHFCTTESVTFAEPVVGSPSVPAKLDAYGSAGVGADHVQFNLTSKTASSEEQPQGPSFQLVVRPRSMRPCPVRSVSPPVTATTTTSTTSPSTTSSAPSSTTTTTGPTSTPPSTTTTGEKPKTPQTITEQVG